MELSFDDRQDDPFDGFPDEFRLLNQDATFTLEKMRAKDGSRVAAGRKIKGKFLPICLGGPMVLVTNNFDYVRTSPVIGVVESGDQSIYFETEGGFYLLSVVGH